MLKIILGRIAQGKSQAIIDSIGERIKNRKKSVLIVPDHATYNFEQRLCRQLNLQGFIEAEVCSFNRLASSIIDFCATNRAGYLDDCTKSMVIASCVLSCKDELTILNRASSRKGFSKSCLNIISTMENCGYSPEYIFDVVEKLDDSILKQKLHDTALIYKSYTEFLSSGYADNAYRLIRAQELLPTYTPLENATVFIDGFDVFTSRLYSFIGALLQKCDVVIALSSALNHDDSAAYEIHEETLRKIKSLASELGIETVIEYASRKQTFKSDEIHFIEDAFYSSKRKTFSAPCQNVHLYQFNSIIDEITFVAKEIALGVRSGNRYKNYAVLCNNLEGYSHIVSSVFARYSIPVFVDSKQDITAHPIALYLFSILKCAYIGFTPDVIGDLLSSHLTPLSKDECDIFTAYMAEMGVQGYELENGLFFKRSDDDAQINFEHLRQLLIEPIKNLKLSLLKCTTAREIAQEIYDFIARQGVYEKISALIEKYENNEFFKLSDVTAQLWNITLELLEKISDIWQDKPISLHAFAEILFEGFNSTPVSTIPSVIDCVTFGDLTAAKEQEVLHTFVIGTNDGIIPAVFSDDRIVSPAESELLLKYNVELAHSVNTEDARIRYNIYSAFSSPKKTLTVSCPLFAQSGASLRPSLLFNKFEAIFPSLKVQILTSEATADLTPLTAKQLLFNIAKYNLSTEEAKAVKEYLSRFPENAHIISTIENAADQPDYKLPTELATKLFLPKTATNISQLENFAACRFAHFINYGLKPYDLKDFMPNNLDIGNLFHNTLELFVKENHKKNLSKEECFKAAGAIFDAGLPNIHFGAMISTSRQRVINGHLKNIICHSAWKIKEQLELFEPIGQEISFGFGKIPPIEISTPYGNLYIKGKIDRADKLSKDGKVYLRIIDYKSGQHTFNESALSTGTDIQIAIYMHSLLTHLGASAHPAGAYYMTLLDNKLSGISSSELSDEKKGVDEAKFLQLLDTAKATASDLASQMLSGTITPTPTKNVCEYCPYSHLCKKGLLEASDNNQAEEE